MPRSRRKATARPPAHATMVRRRPALDFSVTGLIYCALMMFMGLAAINSQANLLFGVFGLMIGILVVSWFVSRSVLRKLTLTRGLPDGAVVGAPALITYEMRNNKRYWPSFSITVAELDGVEAFVRQPQAYMLHAAPHMSAIVPAEVIPKRRGLHTLDRFQFSTSFPFGFVKRAADRRQPEQLLVYPALAEVEPKLLQLMRSADSSGATMRPRRGGMDEFYGLKEHRSGENPRYIYWRRSARTGTLVAKEMTHVSPPRIIVVVDTFSSAVTSAALGDVERAIAMAASLVSHALGAGLSVGLVAHSRNGWEKIAPGRGKRHRRDLLSLLARLPRNEDHDVNELMEAASELFDSATTIALFSASPTLSASGVGFGASGAQSVGGVVVIPVNSPQSRHWFQFHPAIDFAHCMPEEDELDSRGADSNLIGSRQQSRRKDPAPAAA